MMTTGYGEHWTQCLKRTNFCNVVGKCISWDNLHGLLKKYVNAKIDVSRKEVESLPDQRNKDASISRLCRWATAWSPVRARVGSAGLTDNEGGVISDPVSITDLLGAHWSKVFSDKTRDTSKDDDILQYVATDARLCASRINWTMDRETFFDLICCRGGIRSAAGPNGITYLA